MRYILFGVILGMLILVGWYAVKKYRWTKKNATRKVIYDKAIQEGIINWCNDSSNKIKKYDKDDLFSPARMKNGEVDLKGIEIVVEDYTQNVPWFLRK